MRRSDGAYCPWMSLQSCESVTTGVLLEGAAQGLFLWKAMVKECIKEEMENLTKQSLWGKLTAFEVLQRTFGNL